MSEFQKVTMKTPDSQFICKLLDIFERYPEIIGWSANGEELFIKNIKQLEDVILPQYFRHVNFSSFVRQLNMYNFRKTKRQQNSLTFRNQIFRKGNERNFHFIQRKKKGKHAELYEHEFGENHKALLDKLYACGIEKCEMEHLQSLLQYKYVMTQSMADIRREISNLQQCLVSVRSRKISKHLEDLRFRSIKLEDFIHQSSYIDSLLEEKLLSSKDNDENRELQDIITLVEYKPNLRIGSNTSNFPYLSLLSMPQMINCHSIGMASSIIKDEDDDVSFAGDEDLSGKLQMNLE